MPLRKEDVEKMITHTAEKENLKVGEEAIEALFYVSDGDMRRALNTLQGCALHSNKITAELVHKTSSRAKPKEISEMMALALEGKFIEARTNLDKLIITYGLSGEDIMLQIYREIQNLALGERQKVELIDKIGEYDFRMVQGANERIQLEALLAQFALIGKK
jgi:replication factor C small subunit